MAVNYSNPNLSRPFGGRVGEWNFSRVALGPPTATSAGPHHPVTFALLSQLLSTLIAV
jgi:hypothetical protein